MIMMASRAVQISLDDAFLRRIDRDPETKRRGRSQFIRSAVALYLRTRERQAIDTAIDAAYGGAADKLLDEAEALIGAQAWPTE